jgi:endoglucanase Acf2
MNLLYLFRPNRQCKRLWTAGMVLLSIVGLPQQAGAQTVVPVGTGSYAASIPAAKNVTTDTNPVHVLPGTTAPIPTNDWWTPLILKDMYGATQYHLWAHPLDFTIEAYGLGVHYATGWSGGTNSNQQMVSPDPVRVGGAGFAPTSENVKSWGDWTVAFRLAESATEYVDVTIGHGLPFTWLEYTGITSGQVTTDATTTYYNAVGATQTFPFTGSNFGFQWQGRHYAVFAPAGTAFSRVNGVVTAAFAGTDRYLVVAAMTSQANFSTFQQYAYAVPRNSTVSWAYNEEAGTLATTWNVTAQALQGSNTAVLQGFLPHQLKYTTLNFTPTSISYVSARGQVRCAAGNNFQITYPYHGTLSNLPAPEVLPGKPNGYSATQMNSYLGAFSGSTPWLGDANTYGSGKSLTQFARFMANAYVLGNGSLGTLKTKLRAALSNWLTYTPGEPHTYFAYLNNFKALMGFEVGFGSEEFNDHHFHYGYHVYAAGVLGLHDPSFITQYGEMAKLVAKEYANWDRTDLRFPLFRTFDPWEGHSWANGGYGMNPPIGNNQESTSEAMMAWTGIIQLGLASRDQAMTDAGVFGYVTEAAATNEYWFDRDHQNLPAGYGPAGKIGCIVGGSNVEYQTFFGVNPIYVHAIQYIPVMPSSYYLVQNDKYAEAQTEFDYLRNRSVANGFGDIGTWGAEWDNLALQYASMFNPDWAAANQSALGSDAGQAGMSYYTLHSNRSLGRRRFDYHIGAANSGVFYNTEFNQFTYCAFNPTNTRRTYNVYQGSTVIGVITVAANSFFSTHVLNTSSNAAPSVSITTPATGATFAAPATITIEATAADTDGTITQVAFYEGTTLLGVDTSSPYSYTWTSAPAGLHTLTAQATDNGGSVTTSANVDVTVTGGICTGTVANGDYRYEVSTTGGVVTWTFIQLAPIAGSTLAIINIRTSTGGYVGAGMTAAGSNFVFSQSQPTGTALTFYFTYRVGATLTERNSSATPHTYTVGTTCTTLATKPVLITDYQLFPNPAHQQLTLQLPLGTPAQLIISSIIGSKLLESSHTGATTTALLDVSALPKGIYLLTAKLPNSTVTRRFIKE